MLDSRPTERLIKSTAKKTGLDKGERIWYNTFNNNTSLERATHETR